MKGRYSVFCFVVIGAVLSISFWGSYSVSVISECTPVERKHCIILDAGHGGPDGGTTSCTGKLESAYNLEITMRLMDLLHLLGYETKMIRTSDVSVYTYGDSIAQKKISDLKERVRLVNEENHALLLSIHQNYFSDHRYHGAQVFYAATNGSRDLAMQLQANIRCTINPGNTRQPQMTDGIYLMKHIQKTGILIECGFLSNAEEEAKLNSGKYQKEICTVIAATVGNFLSNT